ncbi:MAG TPA: ECF transporter S component [Actinomycetota bacterium]|nr:ECF transporter S component [Actinomycetota bacterium]
MAALHGYAVVLVLAVLGLAATLISQSVGLNAPLWVLGALIAVALLAERESVKISANTEMSISVFPILFAAVLYGPLDAMLIGAFALALECRRPFVRWVIWTFSRSLVAGIAGLAAYSLLTEDPSFGNLLLAAAAAAAAEVAADIALNSLTVAIRGS